MPSKYNPLMRSPMIYTAADFRRNVGRAPEQDDLQWCNCTLAGSTTTTGHDQCGVCAEHNMPVFACKVCFYLSCQNDGQIERL